MLAIVEQNEDKMKICIIDKENFDKMKFIKRVVKYEWASNSSYSGKYLSFTLEN